MAALATKTTEGFDFAKEPTPALVFNKKTWGRRMAKVKRSELILFTTQLSVMLDSGVVISDALDAIVEQTERGTFKTVIADISETVKGGENYSPPF